MCSLIARSQWWLYQSRGSVGSDTWRCSYIRTYHVYSCTQLYPRKVPPVAIIVNKVLLEQCCSFVLFWRWWPRFTFDKKKPKKFDMMMAAFWRYLQINWGFVIREDLPFLLRPTEKGPCLHTNTINIGLAASASYTTEAPVFLVRFQFHGGLVSSEFI